VLQFNDQRRFSVVMLDVNVCAPVAARKLNAAAHCICESDLSSSMPVRLGRPFARSLCFVRPMVNDYLAALRNEDAAA